MVWMVYPYCSECKGNKSMCGQDLCPLLTMARRRASIPILKGRIVEGPSPPSVFVGRFGYPKITIGPLASPVAIPLAHRLEYPKYLKNLGLEEVYSIRSSLIRGRKRLDVKVAKGDHWGSSEPLFQVERSAPKGSVKLLDNVQELALSARSVDSEMRSFRDLGRMERTSALDMITMPMGPSVEIESLRLMDNPTVPNPVERAASDVDLIAQEGVVELYNANIPNEHITRLFSVGLLGEGRRRKLVPTRWSITAVDDTLSRNQISKVMEQTPLDSYQVFSTNSFGNHFLIALYPPPFRFEMEEQWQRGSLWGEGEAIIDWEGPMGRKDYASAITGAYYAARLGVTEHLLRINRNAGCTVLRWITDEYWAPLGVWVIREAVRKALEQPPEVYEDRASLVRRMDSLSGIFNWRDLSRFLGRTIDTNLDRFA